MNLGSTLLFGNLSTWLTPIWLLGMGALLGLLLLGLIVGIVFLASRKLGRSLVDAIREGMLMPIVYLAMFVAGFSLLVTFMVPARALLESTLELPFAGQVAPKTFTIEPAAKDQVVEIGVPLPSLKRVELTPERELTFSDPPAANLLEHVRETVPGGDTFIWERGRTAKRLFGGSMAQFAVTNSSGRPVELTVTAVTEEAFPETRVIPITAISLLTLVALYVLLKVTAPKVSAIALAASKEAISQPIFYVTLAAGAFLLLVSVFIPYNTFGDDVKMVKDSGLTLIMLLSIIVALWTASVSVAEEIEGRTALTVLSKPIGRRQFVIGKFVGIVMAAAVMFVMLGTLFLATISYKVVYDARENSRQVADTDTPVTGYTEKTVTWRECHLEMIGTTPGLVLAFLETVVLAAISVAISTRLPMLPNLIICSSIYVLGHLVPQLSQSTVGRFEPVQFVGQLFSVVLPVLDHFNIQPAIAAGADVPMVYLAWALVYCLLFSSVAMLVALLFFEDRDLA